MIFVLRQLYIWKLEPSRNKCCWDVFSNTAVLAWSSFRPGKKPPGHHINKHKKSGLVIHGERKKGPHSRLYRRKQASNVVRNDSVVRSFASRYFQPNTHLKNISESYTIHSVLRLSNINLFVSIRWIFTRGLMIYLEILLNLITFDKMFAEFNQNLPESSWKGPPVPARSQEPGYISDHSDTEVTNNYGGPAAALRDFIVKTLWTCHK